MSIKVMTRVWEHAPYKESTLLVLLALADYADDNGICYPDLLSLAAKARVSDRRTIDIIKSLEEAGAIAFHRGGGRGKRSCYAVLVGLTDEQQERVKLIHRNYFSENKTVKLGAKKGEVSSKERVKFRVNSHSDLEQQDAPNQDPIRHHDPSADPSSSESGVGDAKKGNKARHVSYLLDQNMGAAQEFADLDSDIAIRDFDNRRKAGQSPGHIVKVWRTRRPTADDYFGKPKATRNGVSPLADAPDQHTGSKTLGSLARKQRGTL